MKRGKTNKHTQFWKLERIDKANWRARTKNSESQTSIGESWETTQNTLRGSSTKLSVSYTRGEWGWLKGLNTGWLEDCWRSSPVPSFLPCLPCAWNTRQSWRQSCQIINWGMMWRVTCGMLQLPPATFSWALNLAPQPWQESFYPSKQEIIKSSEESHLHKWKMLT